MKFPWPFKDIVQLYVTRDSVCAGDDDVPWHVWQTKFSAEYTLEELVVAIANADYLPRIDGGKATWCVSSGVPIAVIAQQWGRPGMLPGVLPGVVDLEIDDGLVRVHVSYFGQRDPEVVLDVLSQLRLKARP